MRYAIPYRRFSSDAQSDGGSIARQTKKFEAFCTLHNLTPWEGQSYSDEGVSGSYGHNRKRGKLGSLLTDLESGRIPKGIVIVIEAQDRLSRDKVRDVQKLINRIIDAGMCLGDCVRDRIIDDESLNDPIVIRDIVLTAVRAFEEVERKGNMVADEFDAKRDRCRTGGEKFTRVAPFWLAPIIENRATKKGTKQVCTGFEPNNFKPIIQRIFQMANNGFGGRMVISSLEKAEPQSPKGEGWKLSTIGKLLRDRRVLGEYQPHILRKKTGSKRVNSGDAIPHYFPPVVDVSLFNSVQLSVTGRNNTGRKAARGRFTNLFKGILFDAATGSRFQLCNHTQSVRHKIKDNFRLIPAQSHSQGKRSGGILYSHFLNAFLIRQRQVHPTECRNAFTLINLKRIGAFGSRAIEIGRNSRACVDHRPNSDLGESLEKQLLFDLPPVS